MSHSDDEVHLGEFNLVMDKDFVVFLESDDEVYFS